MPKRKFLSLEFELATLEAALDGGRCLLASLQEPGVLRSTHHVQALASGVASLSILACRLRHLRFAVRKEFDAGLLLTPENIVGSAGRCDMILRAWSEIDRAKVLEAKVQRPRAPRRRGRR